MFEIAVVEYEQRMLISLSESSSAESRILGACVLMLLLLWLVGCGVQHYQEVDGVTMGTHYRLVYKCTQAISKPEIDARLNELEQIMSTYRDDSQVTRFNQSAIREWVPVSNALVEIVQVAAAVSADTDGSFDITVKPLVDLWGFGPADVQNSPTMVQIATVLPAVDYRAVKWQDSPPALRKRAELSIDLSAIGKGYAVDQMARYLDECHCENYLIDIGGEIRVLGQNSNGKPWQIAMEKPDLSGPLPFKFSLREGALATSGNYRNVRVFGEQKVSHLIDPKLGRPLDYHLTSVTVYSRSAAFADAMSTALFVMGEEKGLAHAEAKAIAVVFAALDVESGTFNYLLSTAMKTLVEL